MYSIVTMARAHDESLHKSQRHQKNWENKRNNAKTLKMTAMCPAWLELTSDRKSFVPIAEHVEVIRRIFELSVSGFGIPTIVKTLNANRIPTFPARGKRRRSEGWHESYVARILSNRAVIGELQPYTNRGRRVPAGDPIKGYYPQILENDLFIRAQTAIRNRKRAGSGRKGQHYTNIFSGLARCAYCDGQMRLLNKGTGPKGGKYLRCANAVRGWECSSSAWRYEDFEASFLMFVKGVDFEALFNDEQLRRDRNNFRESVAALKVDEERLETAVDHLLKAIEDGEAVPPGRLAQRRAELKTVQEALAQALSRQAVVESERIARPKNVEQLTNSIQQLQSQTDDVGKERRLLAAQLQSLVDCIFVQADGSAPFLSKMIEEGEDDNGVLTDAVSRSTTPLFVVRFNDGSTHGVQPDPKDPFSVESELIIGTGDGESIRVTGPSTYSLFWQGSLSEGKPY